MDFLFELIQIGYVEINCEFGYNNLFLIFYIFNLNLLDIIDFMLNF